MRGSTLYRTIAKLKPNGRLVSGWMGYLCAFEVLLLAKHGIELDSCGRDHILEQCEKAKRSGDNARRWYYFKDNALIRRRK